MECAEQKVKVPAAHCDSRVQTVCADVMKLPKAQVRELSPQVLQYRLLKVYVNSYVSRVENACANSCLSLVGTIQIFTKTRLAVLLI